MINPSYVEARGYLTYETDPRLVPPIRIRIEDRKPAEIVGSRILTPDPEVHYVVQGKKFDDLIAIGGKSGQTLENLLIDDCDFPRGLRCDKAAKNLDIIRSRISNPGVEEGGRTGFASDGVLDRPNELRNIRLVQCVISNCGAFDSDVWDQDAHGIIPHHACNMTVAFCAIYQCSGNGIQHSNAPRTHASRRVFVYGSELFGCKQAPLALKTASQTVIAKCVLRDATPYGDNPTDSGEAFNLTYEPNETWIVDTDLCFSQFGIVMGGTFTGDVLNVFLCRFHHIEPSGHPLWTDPEKFKDSYPMRPGTAIVHRRGRELIVVDSQFSNCYRPYAQDDVQDDESRTVLMVNNIASTPAPPMFNTRLQDSQVHAHNNFTGTGWKSPGWEFRPLGFGKTGRARQRFLKGLPFDAPTSTIMWERLAAIVSGPPT